MKGRFQMLQSRRAARGLRGVVLAALGMAAITSTGCGPPAKPLTVAQPYVDQGYKPGVPQYLHGSIFERTDNGNTDPYPISGYSLVVNLQESGDDSGIPTPVRLAMIKKMALAGFGQHDDPNFTHLQPEQVLKDKRVAIVRVIGMLPVGARRGQQFDLIVQAMPRSHTTSLAHGHLYNTELRMRGLDEPGSGGTILAYADAGDVLVNPTYALEGATRAYPGVSAAQVASNLCTGTVMNGGRVTQDRPIFLQLRVPQASIARTIEGRIISRFPTDDRDRPAAAAQDEGLVELFVPYAFNGDWHHFLGVVNHLFLSDSPDFMAVKTHQLMDLAHKPHAPLEDISYCLEAFGPTAVGIYQPMINDADPAIAFAAARAAVFSGDAGALEALTQMAGDGENPCQLAAVGTLGALPQTPAIDHRLEPVLDSAQTAVRIEAYKILAAHADRRILTEDVDGRFKLDMIDSQGPPLVYAARSGEPRLAIFGHAPSLSPPIVFAGMQNHFTIASDELGQSLTLFYREDRLPAPISIKSGPTLAEVVARLGGRGPTDEDHFTFSYPDVVAIVQSLADAHLVMGPGISGQLTSAPLVLDQPPEMIAALASVGAEARPQSDATRPVATVATPGIIITATGGPASATIIAPGSAAPVSAAPVSAAPVSTGEVPSFSSSPAPAGGGVNSAGTPGFGNP